MPPEPQFFDNIPITRRSVKSSNVASVGYDQKRCVLEIEFHSGTVYRYADVPAPAHAAFLNAKSMGIHFARNIKPRFACKKMSPPKGGNDGQANG